MDLSNIPHWLEIASLALVALVLLATILVRAADVLESIVPSSLDPEHIKKAKAIVARAGEIIGAVMLHFPTLFKDPKVQKMAKMIENLEKQLEKPIEDDAPALPAGSSVVEVKADDEAS